METILVMTNAEETAERMQNIIKKYIPDGQKAKAIVMERSDGEDWNSFRRRFAACRIENYYLHFLYFPGCLCKESRTIIELIKVREG